MTFFKRYRPGRSALLFLLRMCFPVPFRNALHVIYDVSDAGWHTLIMAVKGYTFDAVAMIPAVRILTAAGPVFWVLRNLIPPVHDLIDIKRSFLYGASKALTGFQFIMRIHHAGILVAVILHLEVGVQDTRFRYSLIELLLNKTQAIRQRVIIPVKGNSLQAIVVVPTSGPGTCTIEFLRITDDGIPLFPEC